MNVGALFENRTRCHEQLKLDKNRRTQKRTLRACLVPLALHLKSHFFCAHFSFLPIRFHCQLQRCLLAPTAAFPAGKMKARVRWDEANIREIEASKPIRKRITEPKTPYHTMIEDDSSSPVRDYAETKSYAAHAEAIRNALNQIALSDNQSSHSERWTSPEEEADPMEKVPMFPIKRGFVQERDAVGFKEKRRAHYDKFKRVKELQQKGFFPIDRGMSDSNSAPKMEVIREININGGDEILRSICIE